PHHPDLLSFPTRRSSDLLVLLASARAILAPNDTSSLRVTAHAASNMFSSIRMLTRRSAVVYQPARFFPADRVLRIPMIRSSAVLDRKSTRLNSSHLVISY